MKVAEQSRLRGAGGRSLSLAAVTLRQPSLLLGAFAANLLGLALPVVMLQVYDRIVPNDSRDTLLILTIGMAAAFLLEAVLRSVNAFLVGWSGALFEHRLGCAAIRALLDAPVTEVARVPVGAQMERLAAIDSIRDFCANNGPVLFVEIPFAVLYLVLTFVIAGPLVLAPLGLILLFALSARWIGRRLRRAVAARASADERRFSFIVELLGGIQSVKAARSERLMLRRYERLMASVAAASLAVSRHSGAAQALGGIFSQLTVAAVTTYGALLVLDGRVTTGTLAASALLAGRTVQPALRAMGIWTHFQSIAVAKERLREITGLRRESRIAAPALRLRSNTIELRGVGVAYGKTIVLDAVDLEVAGGEAIGISGGNGAGKSTLLRTIAGLIEPDSGRVLVGGVDLSSGNPRSLEGQLAYLPQSSTLVSGTIVDNLTLFRPERAQAALSAAAELELDTHIARLPRGYETWVGGNAEMLAGGVRQSIALARALAGAPRIILFDEANAALDHGSDEALRFALEHRKHTGSTLVIVSHRPSFLRLADRRFELVDGKLVDVAPPPPREALRDLAA